MVSALLAAGGVGCGGGAGAGGAGGGNGAGTGGTGPGGGVGGNAVGGVAGAGGASGTGGVTGTGGASNGGFFDDLVTSSAGMTIAVDASGVIHVAAAAYVQAGFSVVYGRCAGKCGQPQSWSIIALPLESDVSHVPSIALTANGQPRILYASDLGATPGYHYVECDAACDQVASWNDVRLTTGSPTPTVLPGPRIPFAVSSDGAAAFPYSDGSAMYLWLCSSGCNLGTSWTRVTLAAVPVDAKAVAFGSDDSIQLVASHSVQGQASLAWFDCATNCSADTSWANLDGLLVTTGQLGGLVDAEIARTAPGGSRILAQISNLAVAGNQHAFAYLACDSSCRTPASWKPPIQPPIPPESANIGFAFVLDSSGEPAVVTLSDTASASARCTGDCTGTSGQWQIAAGASDDDLDGRYPPIVPASCVSASWSMYQGPDIAFDPSGNLVFAITAHAIAFGGQCGTGSSATTTDSFLYGYAQ